MKINTSTQYKNPSTSIFRTSKVVIRTITTYPISLNENTNQSNFICYTRLGQLYLPYSLEFAVSAGGLDKIRRPTRREDLRNGKGALGICRSGAITLAACRAAPKVFKFARGARPVHGAGSCCSGVWWWAREALLHQYMRAHCLGSGAKSDCFGWRCVAYQESSCCTIENMKNKIKWGVTQTRELMIRAYNTGWSSFFVGWRGSEGVRVHRFFVKKNIRLLYFFQKKNAEHGTLKKFIT